MGTILLGNPANVVVSKVTQIAVLEKKYKVIDWIDDMKSNQLGQLHTIWDVSKFLVESNALADTTDIISNIVPKAVDMHARIVGEHQLYHDQATELRDQIAKLVNDIESIASTASGGDNSGEDGVTDVKHDQAQINAMRSKLLKIVQDNADSIGDVKFAQFTLDLNQMDYDDDHNVTDAIYKFGLPTYTITFKDGETVLKAVTDLTGTPIEVPTVSDKEGYVFDGWTVDDGENLVLPVAKIGTEDVTYTVVWNKLYTITFKDGENDLKTVTGVTGTTVVAPTELEKEGYAVDGWTIDGQHIVLPVAKIGTKDITYTVVWKVAYTITFKDGEEILHTITDVTGTTVAAPAELEKEGYVFDGWTVDGENIVLPVAKIGTENVTYTVVWEAAPEPTSVPTDPIPTPEEIEPHAGEAVTDENRKYDLDGDGDIDPDDIMIAYNYYNPTTPPAPAETEAPVVEPTENPSNGSEETQEP